MADVWIKSGMEKIKIKNMTAQEYLEQNLAGFENDSIARDRFEELIKEKGVELLIETGTYLGSTTKHFSKWCEEVFTIEVKKEHYDQAKRNLKGIENVHLCFGSSEKVIDTLFSDLNISSKVIAFFLDAHWESYNPLLDELKAIHKHGIKPEFIAIHDFKVPGHPELGFDSYKGQDYDWEWIRESVEKIYGVTGFTVEYNSEATGAMRGIIYIIKK